MSARQQEDGTAIKDPFRIALTSSVGAILKDVGYTEVEPNALQSLVEMTQSFISQIGKSSKHYSELANRSQVMVTDVSLALIDSGFSIETLKPFAELSIRKQNRLPPMNKETEAQKVRPLAVNSTSTTPQYVHEGLPNFPDKHAYIQTAAQRHPTTDYQKVRQKASLQRKDAETALTKYIAKTGDANYYCDEEDNPINLAFPLIACKPSALSYLSVLLSKEEEDFDLIDLKQEQELPTVDVSGPSRAKRVRIDPSADQVRKISMDEPVDIETAEEVDVGMDVDMPSEIF